MKGGYKIIDFKNVSLSGTPVTMTDVLVDLLNNYEKVVLLSHVVLSGSAKDDCFSTVLLDGVGGVKLNCYDGYISISSAGAVTYTVASASGMSADIGDLDDLETTEKDSLVGAVNELNAEIGNLSGLNTANKTNIVSAINSKVKSTTISSTSASVHKLNVPSNSRHFLVFHALSPNLIGLVISVGCDSDGVVRVLEVAKGTGVTVTSDTNELTVTLTSAYQYYISDFCTDGSVFCSRKTAS